MRELHSAPLVEVVDADTAVGAAQEGEEGEELVDAGEGRHCLAVLHTHRLVRVQKNTTEFVLLTKPDY